MVVLAGYPDGGYPVVVLAVSQNTRVWKTAQSQAFFLTVGGRSGVILVEGLVLVDETPYFSAIYVWQV